MTNNGYSPQFIFYESDRFFFSGPNPGKIDDPEMIDLYYNLFSLSEKRFNIVYRVAKNFGTIKEYADDLGVKFLECTPTLEFRGKSEKVEAFLGENKELPCYLIVKNIDALDPIKGRTEADEKLFLIDSLARYHIHRGNLRRSDQVLVYSDDQKEYTLSQKPKPPVLKRPDKIAIKLSTLIRDTLLTITQDNLDPESFQRLIRGFWQHNIAIRSEKPESQFLEFWSALEVLFPPLIEQVDRISQISNSVSAFVALEYAAKLAADLYSSIKRTDMGALEILKQVPEGQNEIEKCLALFSIGTNQSAREKFYQLYEWHPLLKNRIYYLNQKFSSADSVRRTLSAHIERVSWQIQRIYRARNLIIHSGKSLDYVDILVENLHSYLDRVLDILNENISRSAHPITIDQIILEVKFKSQSHFRILEGLGGAQCTSKNYKLILFGNR